MLLLVLLLCALNAALAASIQQFFLLHFYVFFGTFYNFQLNIIFLLFCCKMFVGQVNGRLEFFSHFFVEPTNV